MQQPNLIFAGEWAIRDLEAQRLYIPRTWQTEAEARSVLADLLVPYSAGSPWRKRLVVAQVVTGAKRPGKSTAKKKQKETLAPTMVSEAGEQP